MDAHSKMKKMGFGSLPPKYFDDKQSSKFRFHIMEHMVKANAGRTPRIVGDKKAYLTELYRNRPTMALYVHVPWCVEHCTYCYYYGKVEPRTAMEQLLQAEKRHVEMLDDFLDLSGRTVTSIYFGGGTPSVLPADLYEEALGFFSDRFGTEGVTELCTEASISSLTGRKLDTLERYATRVSIGVQSFSDRILGAVARTFDKQKATDLLKELCARVPHVNIDLIYGLQSQTLKEWTDSVAYAIELGIPAITFYQLEIRQGPALLHAFRKNPSSFPDELACREMHFEGKRLLEEAGYRENLVGWFVKPGVVDDTVVYRERWEKETACIALGPGVHNYATDHFFCNEANKDKYREMVEAGDLPFNVTYDLEPYQQFLWFLTTRWKSKVPIDLGDIEARYGQEVRELFQQAVRPYIDWGLVVPNGSGLALTEGGNAVLEWILADVIVGGYGKNEIDDRPIYQIDGALYVA